MTTINAGLFLSIGLGMLAAVGVGGGVDVDVASTRTLWLLVMGTVQSALGGGYLAGQVLVVLTLLFEQIGVALEPPLMLSGEEWTELLQRRGA